MQAAGIELLRFGIFLILVAEMALIIPPAGSTLFVIQSQARHDMWRVAKVSVVVFLLLALAAILITVYPHIALGGGWNLSGSCERAWSRCQGWYVFAMPAKYPVFCAFLWQGSCLERKCRSVTSASRPSIVKLSRQM